MAPSSFIPLAEGSKLLVETEPLESSRRCPMPRGDYRHRETKKPKKSEKRSLLVPSVIAAKPPVEIIRKAKKTREKGEEEEE